VEGFFLRKVAALMRLKQPVLPQLAGSTDGLTAAELADRLKAARTRPRFRVDID
jgi:hypothetical protein